MDPFGSTDEPRAPGIALDPPALGLTQLHPLGHGGERATGVEVDVDPQELPVPDVRQATLSEIYRLVVPVRIEEAGANALAQRMAARRIAAAMAMTAVAYSSTTMLRSPAREELGRIGAGSGAVSRSCAIDISLLGFVVWFPC